MTPNIIPRSGHPISRRDIDPHCLKVLYRLHRAGHQAYLVGGGVRDLLLGIVPKDFDVATDAHPQKVKKLFRNCVLVGRRFRLAHVRFGGTVIEVSTFRRTPDASDTPEGEDLLIRQDNTFGTPEDDAVRRDFTINAMFYDIGTYSLIDYVGGLRDLEDGLVRSIGDPAVRYQEDPVRMIRAVKFAARLSFDIDERDQAAIDSHRTRIRLAAVPRLLEETYRLLRGGASAGSFKLLQEMGLLDEMLPDVAEHLRRTDSLTDPEQARFFRSLFALDEAVAAKGSPSNSFGLAALLLPLLEEELDGDGVGRVWTAEPQELDDAFEKVVVPVLRRLTVSRRDAERLRHVLFAQPRLAAEGGTSKRKRERTPITSRPYFQEAVDVLHLGTALDPSLLEVAEAWRRRADDVPPVDEVDVPRPRARRRRRMRY